MAAASQAFCAGIDGSIEYLLIITKNTQRHLDQGDFTDDEAGGARAIVQGCEIAAKLKRTAVKGVNTVLIRGYHQGD